MSKISIQVRVYNKDLTFRETLGCLGATPAMVNFTAGLIKTEVINGSTAEDRKPFNLCNMMVRRNGKLVSYKEFV